MSFDEVYSMYKNGDIVPTSKDVRMNMPNNAPEEWRTAVEDLNPIYDYSKTYGMVQENSPMVPKEQPTYVWGKKQTPLTQDMVDKIISNGLKKGLAKEALGFIKKWDPVKMEYRQATFEDVPNAQNEPEEIPLSDQGFPEQFKFPTIQGMTDALAEGLYKVGNNPYYYMWAEEPEGTKRKEQLERQMKVYQQEMEKNARDAVEYYKEYEQPAALKWAGENLDAFDIATAAVPGSVFLKGGKFATLTPKARWIMESAGQAGLEGTHAALEGENPAVAAGLAGGTTLGLGAAARGFGRANKWWNANEEAIQKARELNKNIGAEIPLTERYYGNDPIITKSDANKFIDAYYPRGNDSYVGSWNRPATELAKEGSFEDILQEEIAGTKKYMESFGPRKNVASFEPRFNEETGEYIASDVEKRILGELPKSYKYIPEIPMTLPSYDLNDIIHALNNFEPKNAAEKQLKFNLLARFASGESGRMSRPIPWGFVDTPIDQKTIMSRPLATAARGWDFGPYSVLAGKELGLDLARERVEDVGEFGVDKLRELYGYGKKTKESIDNTIKSSEETAKSLQNAIEGLK